MSDVESVFDRTVERRATRHLLLGTIVLAGLLVRAVELGDESLWVDEIHTVRTVLDYGVAFIVFRLPIIDPHPPFYYVVVELWTAVTGVSAVGVRSVSMVAGVLAIPFVYAVAERFYDERVGLFAALLFAFSPFYVWYAREARMYSLMTLLAVLSVYAMLEWLAGRDGRLRGPTGYAVATTLLIYTHAFGALLWVAQNVYVVGFLEPDDVDGRWYESWTRTQGVVVVASFPWFFNILGGMFGAGRFENNVSWIPEVTPVTLWKILGSYVGRTHPPSTPTSRRSLWVFDSLGDLSVVGEVVTLVAFLLLLTPLVRYLRARYLRADDGDAGTNEDGDDTGAEATGGGETGSTAADPTRETTDGGPVGTEPDAEGITPDGFPGGIKPGVYLWCWLLVPVGALYVVSVLVTPLLFDRFTAVAGVAAVILIAREVTRLLETDRQTMMAAGLVVLVLSVPLASIYSQPQKQQWAEATDVVESSAEPGTMVVVTPFWANDTYQYHAERDDLRYAGIPAGAGLASTAGATTDDDAVWFVVAHHNATQRERLMSSLDRLEYRQDRHVSLTELDVYRFVKRNGTD